MDELITSRSGHGYSIRCSYIFLAESLDNFAQENRLSRS